METYYDLNDLKISTDPRFILHIDQFLIYRNDDRLMFSDFADNIIARHLAPVDPRFYEVADCGEHLVFLFSGRTIIAIPKDGTAATSTQIIGKSHTKIYPSGQQTVVVGTTFKRRSQVVKYDYLSGRRILQTASKDVDMLTDLQVSDGRAFAVFGGSLLIGYDLNSGATDLSRFEAGMIAPTVLAQNGVWYASRSFLTEITRQQITRHKALSDITALHCKTGTGLYFSTKTQICRYDTALKGVAWESEVADAKNVLSVKAKHRGKVVDALVLLSQNELVFLNTADGKVMKRLYMDQCYQMKQSGNRLLLHRKNGATEIVESKND